jgi:uncharacterized membrane protein HdeD (DUF308 family)
MLKKSFFLNEDAHDRYHGELHFYIASGVLLIISGVIMILIPAVTNNLGLIVSLSWLLLLCSFLSFVRPFIYGRGFADRVMSICSGLFYAVAGWSVTLSSQDIDGSRFSLSFIMLFTGVSCILAFSSLINVIMLPGLIITGISELVCGLLLLTGQPSYNVFYIYCLVGLLLVIGGLDYFAQAKILARLNNKMRFNYNSNQ